MEGLTGRVGHVGNQHSYRRLKTSCESGEVPLVNFQVFRLTVATQVQTMGNAKDVQTVLRHSKPDTAQINYVQPMEDSVRSAVDKLASVRSVEASESATIRFRKVGLLVLE
jgi:hypothetical protein